jgi:hypothetical protein
VSYGTVDYCILPRLPARGVGSSTNQAENDGIDLVQYETCSVVFVYLTFRRLCDCGIVHEDVGTFSLVKYYAQAVTRRHDGCWRTMGRRATLARPKVTQLISDYFR